MHCPYSKLELSLASLKLMSKLDEEQIKLIDTAIGNFSFPAGDTMKEVANFIGIPLETLVNSPNMKELIQQFEEAKVLELFSMLEKDFNFTRQECWVFFVLAQDPNCLDDPL